eukprot:3936198-Rhodomonas_salina.2
MADLKNAAESSVLPTEGEVPLVLAIIDPKPQALSRNSPERSAFACCVLVLPSDRFTKEADHNSLPLNTCSKPLSDPSASIKSYHVPGGVWSAAAVFSQHSCCCICEVAIL